METKIVYENGYPFFEVDGKRLEPCMFRSFRPTPANVSLFDRAGVKIHQLLVSGEMNAMDIPYSLYGGVWVDEDTYEFANFDRQIQMFQKFSPGSYFIIFLQLDAPKAWLEKHPESTSTFYHLQTAGHDEAWLRAASKYLTAMLNYCEEKYGDVILGYGLTAGRSCEWFSDDDFTHPILKKAWGKEIPAITRAEPGKSVLRETGDADLEFLRFCEKNTVDTALYFAAAAQKTLKHRKLLGLFGGYYALRYNFLLTNQFERVWESPDLDMIWAPAMYDEYRELKNASGYCAAADSIALHGKLHVNELDHRTDMAAYPCEHPVAEVRIGYRMTPGNIMDDCYHTPFEAIMVLRRELASTLLRGSAFWWFDFYGGYYAAPHYEEMLRQHTAIYRRIMAAKTPRRSVAEIAVFLDTPAMTRVREGQQVHDDLTFYNVEEIAKCGAPYDLYHLSDLGRVDMTQYKLAVFPNALELTAGELEVVEKLNCRKVWVYAPGYCSGLGISAVTGMGVKKIAPGLRTSFGDIPFGFRKAVEPAFAITDGEVLGRYADGSICAARKNGNTYLTQGNIPAKVWRELARSAGAHIYSEVDGALYVNNHFICFETVNTQEITLKLQENGIFEEVFDGGEFAARDGKLCYTAPAGTTKLFLRKGGAI